MARICLAVETYAFLGASSLPLFCFENADSGMNEICSALLDAIMSSSFQERLLELGLKKNPLSTSHIYECVNEHFKNVSINIKCGF